MASGPVPGNASNSRLGSGQTQNPIHPSTRTGLEPGTQPDMQPVTTGHGSSFYTWYPSQPTPRTIAQTPLTAETFLSPPQQAAAVPADEGQALGLGMGRGRGRGAASRGRGATEPRSGARGGRGRGIGRTCGAARGRIAKTSCTGWNRVTSTSVQAVMLESEMVHQCFSNKARLFCNSLVEKLKLELEVSELRPTRAGCVIVLIDELLCKCMSWLNEKIVLEKCVLLELPGPIFIAFSPSCCYHTVPVSVCKKLWKL